MRAEPRPGCGQHPSLPQNAVLTPAVAHAPVLDDELVLEGVQDLDLPLEIPQLLGRILLQLLHRHQLPRAVAQRVVAAQLHAPKIALTGESREGIGGDGVLWGRGGGG